MGGIHLRRRRLLYGSSAAIGVVAIGVLVVVSRPQNMGPFTMAVPADHVVFNRIGDNPVAGDESSFMKVLDPVTKRWVKDLRGVQDGQFVSISLYVDNDVAPNINQPALRSRVRVALPTKESQKPEIAGYISADNALPKSVADSVSISGLHNEHIEIAYVQGSAQFQTIKGIRHLPDTIATTGASLGDVSSDESGWITLTVHVNMPHMAIQTLVRIHGEGRDRWRKSANVQVGQRIDWLVEFRNSGSTTLHDVVIVDALPPYLRLEPGSIRLINGNYSETDPYVEPAHALQRGAGEKLVVVNAGSYLPNSNVFMRFNTTVAASPGIACGNQQLTNWAWATPKGYGAVNDLAAVWVTNPIPCPM